MNCNLFKQANDEKRERESEQAHLPAVASTPASRAAYCAVQSQRAPGDDLDVGIMTFDFSSSKECMCENHTQGIKSQGNGAKCDQTCLLLKSCVYSSATEPMRENHCFLDILISSNCQSLLSRLWSSLFN